MAGRFLDALLWRGGQSSRLAAPFQTEFRSASSRLRYSRWRKFLRRRFWMFPR